MSDIVKCHICPHNCEISENSFGFCGVRENRGGDIHYAGYGHISSIALDRIEKKPLHMFRPGKYILSIGGFGCNFHCPFCQNSSLSMEHQNVWRETERKSPEQIVKLAIDAVPQGNIGVAYTYNEPLIGYEFLLDCAKQVHEAGLLNIVVTNGYINREPLETLLPYVDAINIDLKGFSAEFYQKIGGDLDTVKETIITAHKKCHIEVTTLVIPGDNDGDIEPLVRWLASVDQAIPLHLSRFFPRNKYIGREPTSRELMYKLGELAKRYLQNVFLGNMS
jgi:pyruvate formate lyase activating enzyme